ncbi:DUF368 domain-containing protein [Halobacteriovorax sp. DA5]|uniref:DUF368 domain-containing protein n=1 Tax=Halobacteriovorax sp. DA5 TaxID=2067553 RepID=UPI000CD3119D|nr:DUF368 domain-containing protein [Halobacteriovorax sp. DA5]POB15059.1 DUF368 domain-containing protein [Halobacteriovorax sp. DA5]
MINKNMALVFCKGFLMGIADLIPGVSGGTIAFITGIYDKLLETVAAIDKNLIKDVVTLNFKNVSEKIDLKFIIPLAIGILGAMLSLARLMHYLINYHPVPTWGLFLGLISASIIVIARDLKDRKSPVALAMVALGGAIGFAITQLVPVTTPTDLWFIYICGLIGITAMILPGISGSFILLILGKYEYVTGALKNPFQEGALVIIGVFALGCLTGLVSFSKVLNFFMKNFRERTMAFLVGILLGTLSKVWPWREVTKSVVIRGKTKVLSESLYFPTALTTEDILAVALVVIGFLFVFILERGANRNN